MESLRSAHTSSPGAWSSCRQSWLHWAAFISPILLRSFDSPFSIDWPLLEHTFFSFITLMSFTVIPRLSSSALYFEEIEITANWCKRCTWVLSPVALVLHRSMDVFHYLLPMTFVKLAHIFLYFCNCFLSICTIYRQQSLQSSRKWAPFVHVSVKCTSTLCLLCGH